MFVTVNTGKIIELDVAAKTCTITYGGPKGEKGDTGTNGSLAWHDDWSSGHGTYYVNDFVYHAVSGYGKGLFRCKVEHDPSVAATEPVVGGSAGTYWETSVQGGADGADGEGTGDFLADGTVAMTGALTMTQIDTPSEPAASKTAIYPKSTNLCYYANGGAEKTIQEKVDYCIEFCIDGGGAAITTGVKPGLEVPAAGTITAARIMSNDATSGSIVIDLWVEPYADAPPTDADSITSSAPPTVSTATKSEDTTLTGWTKTLAKGDWIVPNVDSCTSIKSATLSLTVARS